MWKTILKNIAKVLLGIGRGALKGAEVVSDHPEVVQGLAVAGATLAGHPEVGAVIVKAIPAVQAGVAAEHAVQGVVDAAKSGNVDAALVGGLAAGQAVKSTVDAAKAVKQ